MSGLGLTFRTVLISNSTSLLKPIEYSVPQGSVLGPLLFLLYINDLHLAIKHSETFHFADEISLNSSKTEFVLFRSNSKTLESIPFIKLLGKRMSSTLVFVLTNTLTGNLIFLKPPKNCRG